MIDYDEAKTGFRREGMYAGVNSLITKPAISFANAAFVMIIGWFGYDNAVKAGAQDAMAKFGVNGCLDGTAGIALYHFCHCHESLPAGGRGMEEVERGTEPEA